MHKPACIFWIIPLTIVVTAWCCFGPWYPEVMKLYKSCIFIWPNTNVYKLATGISPPSQPLSDLSLLDPSLLVWGHYINADIWTNPAIKANARSARSLSGINQKLELSGVRSGPAHIARAGDRSEQQTATIDRPGMRFALGVGGVMDCAIEGEVSNEGW